MYFSSNFGPEIFVYVVLGLLYVYMAVRMDRSKYLWPAILGFVLGAAVFIAASMWVFLHFEFGRDLSI